MLLNPVHGAVAITLALSVWGQIKPLGERSFAFFFSGWIFWNYFTACYYPSSDFLVQNSSLIKKSSFPRLSIVSGIVLVHFIQVLIQMIILIIFLLVTGSGIENGYRLVIGAIVLLLVLLPFQFGVGVIACALITRFRDLRHISTFLVQLLVFVCPVFYRPTGLSETAMVFYFMNPLAGCMEGLRSLLLSDYSLSPFTYVSVFTAWAICALSLALFGKWEDRLVDSL